MAQDSDIQDAYQAFKAYKAFKAQKSKVEPDAADKAAQLGMKDNAQATLNMGKAAVEGAAQGMTLGNVGNIGGAVQSLASYLGKPGQVDRGLESQGFKIEQPSAFQAGKDATNRELDNSYKESPWSYRAGYVGGSIPLAGPGRSLFDAAGGGIKGGMALGATQGALTDIEDPMSQAKKAGIGAAIGGGTQALMQGAVKGIGVLRGKSEDLSRMSTSQANSYLDNPEGVETMAKQLKNVSENPEGMVALQDKAVDAINTSRGNLKLKGMQNAATLRNSLDGKTAEINPADFLGHDPRADEIINAAMGDVKAAQMYPSASGMPSRVSIGGNDLNQLKKIFQEGAQFAPGTVLDPNQAARVRDMAGKSATLRSMVEGLSPEASGLNKEMQSNLLLQQELRKGAKNSPLAFVSSESPDRMATLARAEKLGAGGLFDLGNELGAAKSIAAKDTGSMLPASLTKALGRAGLRGTALVKPAAEELADFPYIQQLIQEPNQTK